MLTIHELVQSALEEFKDCLKNGEGATEDKAYDLIHEIADSNVPIYNNELLEVAMSNLRIACEEPELGPAFGVSTPVNLIMTNIYEYIRGELIEWYDKNKTEK